VLSAHGRPPRVVEVDGIALQEATAADAEVPVLSVQGDDYEGDPCTLARHVASVVSDVLRDA